MKHEYKEERWHKLDNVATVFPLVSGQNMTNVFRMSAQLKDTIDPEVLQKALDLTLPLFSNFCFRIRRGVFWNYFERNQERLLVEEEHARPCQYIDQANNNHYLVKVLYYKKRISIEVFHVITDGTGAVNFLKALTVNYLKCLNGESIAIQDTAADVVADVEDSYRKNYKRIKKKTAKVQKGLKLRGKRLPIHTMGVLHGYLDVDQLMKHCKQLGVSLTIYISAVYMYAIYQGAVIEAEVSRPIHLMVPVNLRRFYDSTSTMNFFSFINIALPVDKEPVTFENVLGMVKDQFKSQIQKERFDQVIASNVAIQQNPFVRILPLPIKYVLLKVVYLKSMQSYTSTLSNVGVVEVPNVYEKYIDHFEVLINPATIDPLKCTMVSFKNQLVVTITSQLEHTYIQKAFFRQLRTDGLDVTIESNGAYYETM